MRVCDTSEKTSSWTGDDVGGDGQEMMCQNVGESVQLAAAIHFNDASAVSWPRSETTTLAQY